MKKCLMCGKKESPDKYECLIEYWTDDELYVICEECDDKHVIKSQIRTDSLPMRISFIQVMSILGRLYLFDDTISFSDIHDCSICWLRIHDKEQLDRLVRPEYYKILDSMQEEYRVCN